MLKSIELESALGIKNGILKKDKIKIDFNKIFPGKNIISIVGLNGSGKSTILNSCHPFSKSQIKGVKYKDLFYNQSGRKKVVYMFGEDEYTFEIVVSKHKTEKIAYLNNKVITNGSREYNKLVRKLFGKSEDFFKTFFLSTKFVTDMGPTELRRHFLSVLGLDQYEDRRKKIILPEIKNLSKQLLTLNSQIDLLNDMIKPEESEQAYETIIKQLEMEYDDLSKQIDDLKSKRKKQEVSSSREMELTSGIKAIESEIQSIEDKIDGSEKVLQKNKSEISDFRLQIDKVNKTKYDLEQSIEEYKNELDEINESIIDKTRIEDDYEIFKVTKSNLDYLKEKRANASNELHVIDKKYEAYKSNVKKIAQLNEKLDNTKSLLICEECPMTNEINEIKQEIEKLENVIERDRDIPEKFNTMKEKVNDIDSQIDEMNIELTSLSSVEYEINNLNNLNERIADIGFNLRNRELDLKDTKNTIKQIESNISDKNDQSKSIQNDINDLKNGIIKLEADKGDLNNQLSLLDPSHDNIDNDIKFIESEKEELYKRISDKKTLFKLYTERQEQKQSLLHQINSIQNRKDKYAILDRLYNEKVGLPAIDLMQACPRIQMIINDLLDKINLRGFDVKFDVKSDTFNIIISRPAGLDATLTALSSGEKVFFNTLISIATVIYLQSKDVKRIKTVYMDEMDGSLDKTENLDKFFELIKIAHEKASCDQTIFVTHNSDSMPQFGKIILDPNSPSGEGFRWTY